MKSITVSLTSIFNLAKEEREIMQHFEGRADSFVSFLWWSARTHIQMWWDLHQCHKKGHNWATGWVDPENGAEEIHCTRCGHDRHVFH